MITVRERLAALREKMADYKMDMYLIGSEDFHGSEYVGEHLFPVLQVRRVQSL